MDNEIEQTKFTAQGRDTPEPVREMSGRAGPTGPSASDRYSLPVGTQAGGLVDTTDNKKDGGKGEGRSDSDLEEVFMASSEDEPLEATEDPYPFRRKSALARSPPTRKTTSTSEVRLTRTKPGEEDEAEKRKRGEESPTETNKGARPKKQREENSQPRPDTKRRENELERALELISKIDKKIVSLHTIATQNRNTKVEIKEIAEELSTLTSKLRLKRLDEWNEWTEK